MVEKKRVQKSLFLQPAWTLKDGVYLLVLVICLPILIYFVLALLIHHGILPNALNDWFFGTKPISEVLAFAITLIVEISLLQYVLRKYHLHWKDLGLKRFKFWKAVGLIVGFYVLFSAIITAAFFVLQSLLPQLDLSAQQQTGFETAHGKLEITAGFIVIVVLAPILEELFFRGFLFPAFIKKCGPIWAALISSAIFGLLHFQTNVSIYTFTLGLFLCYLYYKLKSVIPGIALHMLNNFIAFAVLFKLF